MLTISEKKLKDIMLYLADNGDRETMKQYNLAPASLERYKREARFDDGKIPRVLLLDIETTPLKFFGWGLGKQYVNYGQIIDDWFMLSWSAKWLFSSEMKSEVLTPEESINRDDSRIVKGIWQLMDDADIIIAHNGNDFDIKRLNTRFILNKMLPPMPYKTIDTLKVARRNFAFSSNTLDYLGKLTLNKQKIKTDFKLWVRCLLGEQVALDYMLKYNEEDVLLEEEVYLELRPWIRSHPNMALYMEAKEEVCANCGTKKDLDWEIGTYTTQVSQFTAFRCKNCGAISRCRTSNVSPERRKNLLISTAF